MDRFDNVAVVKKANIYFDGKCVSHTVVLADGTKKSVGVIFPSRLTFNTGAPEIMEINAGRCRVLLPGSSDWQTFAAGQQFSRMRLPQPDAGQRGCVHQPLCGALARSALAWASVLPPSFWQVPLTTYFHSPGSLSVLASPAQPWVSERLAQSFWPAWAMPKHFC